jgi:hypothetical protein
MYNKEQRKITVNRISKQNLNMEKTKCLKKTKIQA